MTDLRAEKRNVAGLKDALRTLKSTQLDERARLEQKIQEAKGRIRLLKIEARTERLRRRQARRTDMGRM